MREAGWKQGCCLRISLPLSHITVEDGRPREQDEIVDDWVLVAQDCDLAWKAILDPNSDFLVELRPIFDHNPPADWGIRGQRFLLDASGIYLDSNQPRLMVHPSVLSIAEHLSCPLTPRRLKTWLGLRYDRPAIPQAYLALADILVKKIKAKRTKATAARARDILASFDTSDNGQVEFELIAVLPSPSSKEALSEVEEWISGIALDVPPEVGIATRVEARPDEEVSLAFVENSYVLDATSLTWPISSPGPSGESRP